MPAPVGDPIAVSADLEAQQGGAAQTAKDLFSGAVGGIAQVLVGMYSTLIHLVWKGSEPASDETHSVFFQVS